MFQLQRFSPKDAFEETIKFEDIVSAMNNRVNFTSQSYEFYSWRQEVVEPFEGWFVKLKDTRIEDTRTSR